MLLNYYTALYANYLRLKGHVQYFEFEQCELNPLWKQDMQKSKIFNIKHLIGVCLMTLYIYFLQKTDFDKAAYKMIMGFVVSYGLITLFRSYSNILLFKFVIKNPSELEGKLLLKTKYQYYHSLFALLPVLGPLLGLLLYIKSYYLFGAIIAIIAALVAHIIMFKFTKKRMAHNKKR